MTGPRDGGSNQERAEILRFAVRASRLDGPVRLVASRRQSEASGVQIRRVGYRLPIPQGGCDKLESKCRMRRQRRHGRNETSSVR